MRHLLFVMVVVMATVSEASDHPRKNLIAAVLICEAGGEGPDGIRAVAEVIRNRSEARKRTAYQVVTQPWQFSCLNGRQESTVIARAQSHPRWAFALRLASEIEKKSLRSNLVMGADHYHTRWVAPSWCNSLTKIGSVGNHIFYRSIRRS